MKVIDRLNGSIMKVIDRLYGSIMKVIDRLARVPRCVPGGVPHLNSFRGTAHLQNPCTRVPHLSARPLGRRGGERGTQGCVPDPFRSPGTLSGNAIGEQAQTGNGCACVSATTCRSSMVPPWAKTRRDARGNSHATGHSFRQLSECPVLVGLTPC